MNLGCIDILNVGGFKACPIVTVLRFGDGTSIGTTRLFEEVGFTFKEL